MLYDLVIDTGIPVSFNQCVVNVDLASGSSNAQPSVILESGERIFADVIIGADGGSSLVRELVFEDADEFRPAPFTSYTYVGFPSDHSAHTCLPVFGTFALTVNVFPLYLLGRFTIPTSSLANDPAMSDVINEPAVSLLYFFCFVVPVYDRGKLTHLLFCFVLFYVVIVVFPLFRSKFGWGVTNTFLRIWLTVTGRLVSIYFILMGKRRRRRLGRKKCQ